MAHGSALTLGTAERHGRAAPRLQVADVGRAINPLVLEGQDEGAVMQGLGHTLMEEMVYEDGHLLNGTLLIYRVPRAEDVPDSLECRFVENADGSGPFGAKGAGEGSLVPVSNGRRERGDTADGDSSARAAAHARARLARATQPLEPASS